MGIVQRFLFQDYGNWLQIMGCSSLGYGLYLEYFQFVVWGLDEFFIQREFCRFQGFVFLGGFELEIFRVFFFIEILGLIVGWGFLELGFQSYRVVGKKGTEDYGSRVIFFIGCWEGRSFQGYRVCWSLSFVYLEFVFLLLVVWFMVGVLSDIKVYY